jgi:hypothetical protein
MQRQKESAVVKACLEYLAFRGIAAWRVNTGALPTRNGGFVRFGRPGMSDIMGVLGPCGRMLAVECKTAAGRLTGAQRTFLATIRTAGGLAVVVRSVDELAAALHDAGYDVDHGDELDKEEAG